MNLSYQPWFYPNFDPEQGEKMKRKEKIALTCALQPYLLKHKQFSIVSHMGPQDIHN